MIADFKTTKFYFENMFATLWATTPIHFMYQEFKQPTKASWINLIYHPSRITSASLSRGNSMVSSTLGVVCWAENDVEVLDLLDNVVKFIEENNDHQLFQFGDVQIIDQGVDGSNKAFVYLHFSVESMAGVCDKITTTRNIVNGANAIVNNSNKVVN